jgi:SulP family sulfate permease|uniref:SLC26A/SulP transporter domain-containing protein n=1 Tax=viral metagenome TaxID=1070528 RepID=A0A6C0CBB2_9ZZZZ
MEATNIINEIISGFTIALVLIPESIAFSLLLGFPPSVGLISTAIMSSITSLFGGCPTLISGATGAIATSLLGVKALYGTQYVFLTAIIGGFIQLLFGISGLYKYFSNISQPLMTGFLIALGVLIAKSQIKNFKYPNTENWFKDSDNYKLTGTLLFSLISLFIAVFGKFMYNLSYKTKSIKINIPGALSAIVLLSILYYIIPIKETIEIVGDRGGAKITNLAFNVPNVELTSANILKVLPFAVAMAITGLTESIFMVDDTSKQLKIISSPLIETLAQGVGNIISGLCGGFGGCVFVGLSKYNVENGSKTRLSSRATSLFFIALTLMFSSTINKIPMPAIIGIMIMIAFKTGTAKYDYLIKNFKSEWLIILLTASLGIYSESLALAIIVGFIVQQAIKYIKSI